jgi:hypothetical protein
MCVEWNKLSTILRIHAESSLKWFLTFQKESKVFKTVETVAKLFIDNNRVVTI